MRVLSLFDGISGARLALNLAEIPIDKYYASEIDPLAISVASRNFPNSYQLGDVTDITANSLGHVDLIIAGSPCFVTGTKVIKNNEICPIEEINVGDKVLTHTGKYQEVLKIGGCIKEIWELQSQSGTITETTENHPYWVREKKRIWNNDKRRYEFTFLEPEFVKVKNLRKNHYTATPILTSSLNPLNLTEDECFVIGLYIGDGHTRKDYRVSEGRPNDRRWELIISVGEHEADLFKSVVNLKHSFYKHTQSVYRAVFYNKRLVKYVESNCGTSSYDKIFSKAILDLPIHLLKKVIEGYLFADGSFRNGVHRATTVSRQLVESLTLAVAKVYKTTTSIEHTKRPKTTIIQGRVVNQSDTWTISFRENHPKQSRAWVIDGYVWNPIKRLVNTNNKKQVFNLEVKDDNSYIANNHVVHNCQGFSNSGKGLNFEDDRSALFFEFIRLLDEFQPPYFLLENVRMKREWRNTISQLLFCEPYELNSEFFSAQSRPRLYWFNWDLPHLDKVCPDSIQTILDDENPIWIDEIYPAVNYQWTPDSPYFGKVTGIPGMNDQHSRIHSSNSKCPTIIASNRSGNRIKVYDENAKRLRFLSPLEMERLQGFPDHWTAKALCDKMVSTTARTKMLGNAFQVNTVAFILQGLHYVQ